MNHSNQLGLSPRDHGHMEYVRRLAQGGPEGVPSLVGLLGETSWAVRRAVVAALARMGTPAVPPLCAVLQGDRTNEAKLAAAVDALVGSSADIERALVGFAEHVDAAPVLSDVAQILGRRKSRDSLALLTQWADHPDDNVAVAAIEALGRIDAADATEPLLHAAQSGNFFRTFPAIALLGQSQSGRVVEPLAALLREPYYAVEAAVALGRTGRIRAVAPLARLLAHENDAFVVAAARALRDLHLRHAESSGDPRLVIGAFRSEVAAEVYTIAITRALVGASPAEKVSLATMLAWLNDRRGITILLELLDSSQHVAADAIDALRSLSQDAEPLVREAVRSGDSARRIRLIPLLGARRSAVGELVACLGDSDPAVRILACDALGRIGEAAAVGPLFDLIGDPAVHVAQSAIAAVQSLGGPEAMRRALLAARSPDSRTRRASLRIVSYFGCPEALEILLEAVGDPDERIRDVATAGLALLDDPRATTALLSAAKNGTPAARAAALRALGSSATQPAIVSALLDGLQAESAWVRYYACQSLGKLRATEAAEAIAARVDDPAGQVRVAAIEAMALVGGDHALATLDAASMNPDEDVRRAALLRLATLRRPEALSIALRAAESEDPTTRLIALSSIAAFGGPEALRALVRATSDLDDRVRTSSFALIAQCPGASATQWLIEQLDHSADAEHALAALSVPVEGRVEGMLTALQTSDASLSTRLVQALQRIKRAHAYAAIEAVMLLENVHARRAAATALASLGTPSARAALDTAAALDADAEVRRICASVP